MSGSSATASTWAPLRARVFRALWLSGLASNIGAWMQTVGAQWLLVQQPHASLPVALVQTADTLPDLLFAYVGGILADTLDRRRILIAVRSILVAASVVYAAVLVALVLVPNAAVVLVALVPAGAAWIAVLSTVNAVLQLFLPAWVRARGLAIYRMVLFGTQAVGAVIWGALAQPLGLATTLLVAAAAMVAGVATLRAWPLTDTSDIDRSLAVYWPEPNLILDPAAEGGPVAVEVTYTIAPERKQPFLDAMARLRRSRLRTGAMRWGLFRDGERAQRFVEFFIVPDWEEHLRQHADRLTGADRQNEEQADALSDPPPQTSLLVGVNLRDRGANGRRADSVVSPQGSGRP